MQKFYWNNGGATATARDWRDIAGSHGQTLTLAINDCNSSPYLQVNNRRTIRTNEHLHIKSNDNEFYPQPSHLQHSREFNGSDGINFRIKTPATKNHSAKTIDDNSNSSESYIKVNGNKQCIQVNQSYLKDAANTSSLNSSEGNGNKVVLRLGDISSLELSELPLQRSYKGCQAKWQHGYNKTWNENMKGKYRQSIQTADIFQPGYDPVFGSVRDRRPERDMSRQTPRSRKKSKQPGHGVYRSKSCEKVAGVIDKLSGKLSLTSQDPPSCPPTPAPPTPTPSILHSVAARAIPCVDIKPPCISSGGRVSPAESLAYEGVGGDTEGSLAPSRCLADKMRGRLEYVNKKMKIIRSRSAERLRGCVKPELMLTVGPGERQARPVRRETRSGRSGVRPMETVQYSGPVVGQARALVSCLPSPYDNDMLAFQAGDIIEVLQMNPNGLWRGRCRERIGQFKFINVELLPVRRRKRSSSRSLRKMRRSKHPESISEVMKILDMTEYLPVFVLNGYEDLTLFKDLDEDELDYLGISEARQRQKLIDMANLLFPDEKHLNNGESSDDDDDNNDDHDSSDSSSESGIADIHSDEAYSSFNSIKQN